MADNSMAPAAETAESPKWGIGLAVAVATALVAAIIVAAITAFTDDGNVYGFTALLIPLVTAIAFVAVGKVRGAVAGAIAAVLGIVAWLFSYDLGGAWWLSRQGYGSVLDRLGDLVPDTWDVLKPYLDDSPSVYFWAVAGVIVAFIIPVRRGRQSSES